MKKSPCFSFLFFTLIKEKIRSDPYNIFVYIILTYFCVVAYLYPTTCKLNYVNMRDNYMYVNTQHAAYIDMLHNYVNMGDNYVNMRFKIMLHVDIIKSHIDIKSRTLTYFCYLLT